MDVWPDNPWVSGDPVDFTNLNKMRSAHRTWLGQVNANGQNLTNLGEVSWDTAGKFVETTEVNIGGSAYTQFFRARNGDGTNNYQIVSGINLSASAVGAVAAAAAFLLAERNGGYGALNGLHIGTSGSNSGDVVIVREDTERGRFTSTGLRLSAPSSTYAEALLVRQGDGTNNYELAGGINVSGSSVGAVPNNAAFVLSEKNGAFGSSPGLYVGTAAPGGGKVAFVVEGTERASIETSGRMKLVSATAYDSDAAAGTGGVASGELFWDSNGFLRRKS